MSLRGVTLQGVVTQYPPVELSGRDRDQNLDRLKSGLDRACKPFLIV